MDELDAKIQSRFQTRVTELKEAQAKAKTRIEECQNEQRLWQQHEQQATAELIGLSRSIVEIEKVLTKPPEPLKPEPPKE